MPDVADSRSRAVLPQIWRVPPWQPAALILLATVLIALVLYGNFALGPSTMMIAVALAALTGALLAIRFVLVADDDGIWIRRVFAVDLVEWPDLAAIEVVHVHANTPTLRITRVSGTHVDVPPTLLQPSLPTGIRKARTLVASVAQRLLAISADKRG